MWNASYMQKHSNYTWQEWGRWKRPEKVSKKFSIAIAHARWNVWQIARTVPNEKNETKLFGNGMAVLGLATSHCRKIDMKKLSLKQVRQRDVSLWYHWLSGRLRWHRKPVHTCAPCYKSGRSFYICFRCFTHTPRCRGVFKAPTNEMKVKMKGKMENEDGRWKWDDNYLTGTQEGERKKGKEKGKTPTPTHLAQNGQTLKGQGKKKKAGRMTGQTPTRGGGGRTEAPDTTYKARAKNLPRHVKDPNLTYREGARMR